MQASIVGNGETIKEKEKVSSDGLMVESTKAISEMIASMDKENSNGQMVEGTLDNGRKAYSMALVPS